MSDVFTLRQGRAPLLISVPHDGSAIPADLQARMVPEARTAPDTDWWMSRLYGPIAEALDASLIVPRWSRYVIDLNRPPDDTSLYPGQNTTGLCPTVQFSGDPIYFAGQAPSADEINERRERYWQPYHVALAAEVARLRRLHAEVLLWEGHSIRSEVPFLFDGHLSDLNVGTAAGASCSPAIQQALEAALGAQSSFSWVVNGRFKGGYITRHYGQPEKGVHAIQLETAQAAYMTEPAGPWEPARAASLQQQVKHLLTTGVGVITTSR